MDRAIELMGHAMATNRWVPGPNPRAADEAWKVVLALAYEDAAIAVAALEKAGLAVFDVDYVGTLVAEKDRSAPDGF